MTQTCYAGARGKEARLQPACVDFTLSGFDRISTCIGEHNISYGYPDSWPFETPHIICIIQSIIVAFYAESFIIISASMSSLHLKLLTKSSGSFFKH